MKFDKYFPADKLRDYIKYYVVSENDQESAYRVFPSSGLVIGFQYKGQLATIQNNHSSYLAPAGITGMTDSYKTFKNTANTGTILVYFTETGLAHFTRNPVNELFNLSIPLDALFNKNNVQEVESRLSQAASDKQRISIVERFLLTQIKDMQADALIVEAVRLIYQQKGVVRVKELNEKLWISQSPFEKRFRKIVGTTPKKFASIVRFNAVLSHLPTAKSLTDICYEYHFFDQAHFIKAFKQFTGSTPEQLKRFL